MRLIAAFMSLIELTDDGLKSILSSTATTALSALGATNYSTLVEPHWLALERVDVPLPHLPAHLNGFTTAQLSGLRRGPEMTPVRFNYRPEVTLVTLRRPAA